MRLHAGTAEDIVVGEVEAVEVVPAAEVAEIGLAPRTLTEKAGRMGQIWKSFGKFGKLKI